MGEIPVRRIEPDEGDAFIRSVRVPFLDPATNAEEERAWTERAVRRLETGRCWVAEDDGRFVANCEVRTMDLTVPSSPGSACPVMAMGGVTAVGVHPTHRRRGLLGRMMAEMLDDSRRRGEPVAGLIASESVIYGRFGFGLATDSATLAIDTREAAMLVPPPALDLRLVERDEAAKVLPELFDRQRTGRAGEVCRPTPFWEELLSDEPKRRQSGAAGLFVAVCDEGYVAYRALEDHSNWKRDQIIVEELRGTTAEVEAGLWQYVFGIDLTDQVSAPRRAIDEPLRWRLADPRQLRTTEIEDRLYLRILDVTAAFETRGYRDSGRLVLDVLPPPARAGAEDPVPGRWLLEVGPDGASCRGAAREEQADLRLDVTALGSLYMGAYPASLLAAAGRVEELTAGSLAAADRLLTTSPAPLTVTGF
ncbi:MAG TPA: GNAT family N-acetyltransferase [Acidimicrobiales bacterium]|nr:GNAT family N-acetyltransferase [Acidimicrobiales bacterium]